jgi:hypothetical protein
MSPDVDKAPSDPPPSLSSTSCSSIDFEVSPSKPHIEEHDQEAQAAGYSETSDTDGDSKPTKSLAGQAAVEASDDGEEDELVAARKEHAVAIKALCAGYEVLGLATVETSKTGVLSCGPDVVQYTRDLEDVCSEASRYVRKMAKLITEICTLRAKHQNALGQLKEFTSHFQKSVQKLHATKKQLDTALIQHRSGSGSKK